MVETVDIPLHMLGRKTFPFILSRFLGLCNNKVEIRQISSRKNKFYVCGSLKDMRLKDNPQWRLIGHAELRRNEEES